MARGMAVQALPLQPLLWNWYPEPADFVLEFLALPSVPCVSVKDAAHCQVLGNSSVEWQCLFWVDECTAWLLQVLRGAVPSHSALSDGNSSEIISKLIYVLGVTGTRVQTPSCSDTARVRAGLRLCPESQPSSSPHPASLRDFLSLLAGMGSAQAVRVRLCPWELPDDFLCVLL